MQAQPAHLSPAVRFHKHDLKRTLIQVDVLDDHAAIQRHLPVRPFAVVACPSLPEFIRDANTNATI